VRYFGVSNYFIYINDGTQTYNQAPSWLVPATRVLFLPSSHTSVNLQAYVLRLTYGIFK
jgi:hypothetical protein